MQRYAFSTGALAAPLLWLALVSGSAAQEVNIVCGQQSGGVVGTELQCPDATITDGRTTIHTGLLWASDQAGEFRFSAGVSVVAEEVELSAESAGVKLENSEFVAFELQGSPARMSKAAGEGVAVAGEAQSIVYDARSGDIHLVGEVRFVFGDNVFSTCELLYNTRSGRYQTPCEVNATVRRPEPAADNPAEQREGP